MKSIGVSVPDEMKARLDHLRTHGFTLNGYIRSAISRALAAEPDRQPGEVALRYRKPGGRWQRRRVPAGKLEKTVLRLEAEGAEILT